ncbi:MAG: undecaprenyl-diphosphate phosphatase [Balneolia bacterium]|nr:undecaprenyl-diphosphate phosphatase [Balneolia bacterium]
MDALEAFILGLVQGITEFLPISSSGHLRIASALLGQDLDTDLLFDLVVHFGTLFSIFIYFRERLTKLIFSVFRVLKAPVSSFKNWDNDYELRFNTFILVSMIPAGLAGFTIRDQVEGVFANPIGISSMFLFTGIMLYATKFFDEGTKGLTLKNTFLVGLAQALALLPGVSRSGMTISVAVFLGIRREDIANFTFIMMIPVVAGATLLDLLKLQTTGVPDGMGLALIIGFFTALVSGYYALKYLIILFKSKGIFYFAWYCWAIGLLGLTWFWLLGRSSLF